MTEPKLATWKRFRGRLSNADLLMLLFEDAAILHRVPFDAPSVGSAIRPHRISEDFADTWLNAIANTSLTKPTADFVAEQAKLLGIPTRLARSELHVVKPHQKVLELPGTGGQLAHHLVSTQSDLTLQDNFVIAGGSWQELTLAGIVALELGAPHSDFVTAIQPEEVRKSDHPLRKRGFDLVIGLHSDKGGAFKAQDELEIWFPNAKILLI